ncbi:DUF948 domain-containing protein [Aliibacillus thermotolerans]|uniref:DUF948 domain-containing protein n=1 Tax=Aliibacillus thermotolerans TaxID=1834418 RepID=A0ABW0U4N2_9BACI|nr:DUF948 domain-containing protein [Aliibacillus thermotolerans]MDA3129229.1 DUF948 domain-containing protein [Aliibacillus thermotolerans]
MDLIGISILIIAIAFAVLTVFIINVLNRLSNILENTNKTIEKLPEQLDGMLKETEVVIHNSNETILDLNEKLHALNPIFYMIADAGEASRKLSSSLVDVTNTIKKSSEKGKEVTKEKDLSGIYGLLSFVYFMYQKRQTLKDIKKGKDVNES